ncbi:MAG: uracil-DNA glycosylase [Pseudohongiellaceae bacterium]
MTEAAREIKLEPSWLEHLQAEFNAPYMSALREFLLKEKQTGKKVFPPGDEIFNAFNATPFEAVKVVILGQDPYYGPGQAHGLCFSVKPGVSIPCSLRNIYKELEADVGCKPVKHGHLQSWAEQGVLLLNATLTVEAGKAGSHQGKGWEKFTDKAISILDEQQEGLVFLLWGDYAQRKGKIIKRQRHHLVLSSPHPSPRSASRGFFGQHHFSRANAYLESKGKQPINWQLPESV